MLAAGAGSPPGASAAGEPVATPQVSQAEQREARKALARVEKQLSKVSEREETLHAALVEHATDYEKLAELNEQLQAVVAEKESLEEEWLEAASVLE